MRRPAVNPAQGTRPAGWVKSCFAYPASSPILRPQRHRVLRIMTTDGSEDTDGRGEGGSASAGAGGEPGVVIAGTEGESRNIKSGASGSWKDCQGGCTTRRQTALEVVCR